MNLARIDEFLLGRRRQNGTVREFFSKDAIRDSGEVAYFGNNIAITTQRDDSPAAVGAATALLRTTGTLPTNFGRKVDEIEPIGSDALYQKLMQAGVRVGTKTSQLQSILGRQQGAGQNPYNQSPLSALMGALNAGMADSQPSETTREAGAKKGARAAKGGAEAKWTSEALVDGQSRTYPKLPKVQTQPTGSDLSYGDSFSALTELLRRY